MVSRDLVNEYIDKCNKLLEKNEGKRDSEEMTDLAYSICDIFKDHFEYFRRHFDYWQIEPVELIVTRDKLILFRDKYNCGEIFVAGGV